MLQEVALGHKTLSDYTHIVGKETTERILSTAVTARWRHDSATVDWADSFATARLLMLERFAEVHSLSLQQ